MWVRLSYCLRRARRSREALHPSFLEMRHVGGDLHPHHLGNLLKVQISRVLPKRCLFHRAGMGARKLVCVCFVSLSGISEAQAGVGTTGLPSLWRAGSHPRPRVTPALRAGGLGDDTDVRLEFSDTLFTTPCKGDGEDRQQRGPPWVWVAWAPPLWSESAQSPFSPACITPGIHGWQSQEWGLLAVGLYVRDSLAGKSPGKKHQ